jgi:hypothetical protein
MICREWRDTDKTCRCDKWTASESSCNGKNGNTLTSSSGSKHPHNVLSCRAFLPSCDHVYHVARSGNREGEQDDELLIVF